MNETKTRTYKVLDTPTLIKANKNAVRLEQNRSVTDEFLDMLDPEGTHVIGFNMDHVNFYGTPGIRCNIHCKLKGEKEVASVWIDVTHEEFLGFPTIDYP
jgi:hypothetical protein